MKPCIAGAVLCVFMGSSLVSASTKNALNEVTQLLSKQRAQLKYDVREITPCIRQGLGHWTQTRFVIVNWKKPFPVIKDVTHTGDAQYRLLFFAKLTPEMSLLCVQNNTGMAQHITHCFFKSGITRVV